MSRRTPNPAAERAAQNQQTIKTLLKLEGNKTCADCKRNKRMPSPISWRSLRTYGLQKANTCPAIPRSKMGQLESRNLCLHTVSIQFLLSTSFGLLMRTRCSGIHRGMGTHISRVKSVDLDAWTDEQLQSVLRWGNSRANKSVLDHYGK